MYDMMTKEIRMKSNFTLQEVIGEPIKIRNWTLNGLPSDAFSIDNGVIAFNSRRWPLMIDPEGQASKWIKNMSGQSEQPLWIVKPTSKDFIRVLETAITLGENVLIENCSEELDPVLDPLLAKQVFKNAGVECITFAERSVEYNKDFKLQLLTKLNNPHYLPEVSAKVTIINFMITFDGLWEQLLNLVIQNENMQLDEERQKLIVQNYEFNKSLNEIEERILEILRTSEGDILDD
jgi:dynein heavy chain, axonemal